MADPATRESAPASKKGPLGIPVMWWVIGGAVVVVGGYLWFKHEQNSSTSSPGGQQKQGGGKTVTQAGGNQRFVEVIRRWQGHGGKVNPGGPMR